MINLVFYNSYQHSYVGFQSAQYQVGSAKLISEDASCSECAETKNLLLNSGCVCALGKSRDSKKQYFVYRGLNIRDANDREWYINLGIEADEDSSEQFYNVITGLLLDFNAFKTELKNWFIATPDNSFSYDLNYEFVNKYISNAKEISVEDIGFYGIDSPYVTKFKNMLSDVKMNTSYSLLLLVPETTLNYFNKQNPFFENIEKHYVFDADVFKGLAEHNKTFLPEQENAGTKEKSSAEEKQYTAADDDPVCEFIEENKHTIELACKIAVVTLAAVGTGVIIKKIFF